MDKAKIQKIVTITSCVLLSLSLWVYNVVVEDPQESMNLMAPVTLENTDYLKQKNLALVPGQDLKSKLILTYHKSDIRKINSSQFKLVINFSNDFALNKGTNRLPVTVVEKSENILSLDNNELLWVDVKLDEYSEKTVPIYNNINLNTGSGYTSINSILSAEEGTVSGCKSIVDTVSYLSASGNFEDVNENFKRDIELKAYKEIDTDDDKVVENVDINPKTVEVSATVLPNKKVPIVLNSIGSLRNGLSAKSTPILSKDSVLVVSENEGLLQNLESIQTEPLDLNSITESTTKTLKLVPPDGVTIVSSFKEVNVSIEVTKTAEKTVSTIISISNIKQGLTASLVKDEKASVAIAGEESIINNVKDQDVHVYLDLSTITEPGNYTLQLNYLASDKFSVTSFSPAQVEVEVKSISESSSASNNSPLSNVIKEYVKAVSFSNLKDGLKITSESVAVRVALEIPNTIEASFSENNFSVIGDLSNITVPGTYEVDLNIVLDGSFNQTVKKNSLNPQKVSITIE